MGGKINSRKDLPADDFRLNMPRFSEENFHRNLELTQKITSIAQKKNVTGSQLTLAWLMAQGEDVIPIPGTTNIDRLKENLAALKIQVTPEESKDIRQACENADIIGERYPEQMAHTLFADTPPLKA